MQAPKLKDVTPTKQRSGNLHIFDYTYRPYGRNTATTRLRVALRRENDKWVLSSIIESNRPR